MSYRSTLEARIARKVTRAITEHRLIEDGDRIMVGLSGGKDSWALMQILDVLRQRAPITFSLVAVTVDSGYEDFRHDLIHEACVARGWEHHVERTSIGSVMDDLLDPGDTPCSLCARFRRGVLYRLAAGLGATKIALGHHSDDFIETLLLNLFFAGSLKAMPARLVSDNGRHVVIRPLFLVSEDEARAYAKELRAADCELLLLGVRRPRPPAPAREAAHLRSRARARRRQGVDAARAVERHAGPPTGCAPVPAGGAGGAGRLSRPRRAAGRSFRESGHPAREPGPRRRRRARRSARLARAFWPWSAWPRTTGRRMSRTSPPRSATCGSSRTRTAR